MAESKNQKNAKGRVRSSSLPPCKCGGDVRWMQWRNPHPVMHKTCEKCGEVQP